MKIRCLLLKAECFAACLIAASAGDAGDLQDSWSLVQIDLSQVHSLDLKGEPGGADGDIRLPKQRLDTSGWARGKWPSMGNIWDEVKESMENITSHSGDIMQDPVGGVIYNKTVEAMALVAAKSLSGALLVVDKATEKLLNKTLERKAELLKFMNSTGEEVLPLFELVLNRTLEAGLAGWKILRDVVDVSGEVLSSSMRAAGQDGVSLEFEKAMDRGLSKMDNFVGAMGNASVQLAGISKHMDDSLELELRSLDARFRASLDHVPQFAVIFQEAFQNLVDHISDALPMATPQVHSQFQLVLHNVTSIVWHVRSSSRELVLSCHSAVSAVAKQHHTELPSWEVATPKPQDESAATRAEGLLVAFLLAALLAVRP